MAVSEYRCMWAFFSVLAGAFDEDISSGILSRWGETDLFEESPFGAEDRYVNQGVKQVRLWLEDFKHNPEIISRLKQDYIQLFVGVPKPLAPYWGSAYLDREKLLFHEKTAEAGKWYRKYELAVKRNRGMPEDYLVYELFFLTVLLESYQRSVNAGEQERALGHLSDMQKFISEQMLPWITAWWEDMMLYARTEYYRGLANMVYGGILLLAKMEVGNETDYY